MCDRHLRISKATVHTSGFYGEIWAWDVAEVGSQTVLHVDTVH